MFGFTGAALSKIRHMQNGGKRARHSIDQWDRVCRTPDPANSARVLEMAADSGAAKYDPPSPPSASSSAHSIPSTTTFPSAQPVTQPPSAAPPDEHKTDKHSDGPRQAPNRIPARANRQSRRTARLRAEQSLEGKHDLRLRRDEARGEG